MRFARMLILGSQMCHVDTFRTRDSKQLQTTILYWNNKQKLGKVLMNHKEEKKKILLHMDEMQLQMTTIHDKLYIIAKATIGFEFMSLKCRPRAQPPPSFQEVSIISITNDEGQATQFSQDSFSIIIFIYFYHKHNIRILIQVHRISTQVS